VLGFYASDRVLGQFQAAAWFPVATYLGASLLMAVLFPQLSRLMHRNSARGHAYVVGLLKIGLLLAGLAGLLVWFTAPTLLLLLFGKAAMPAAGILRILAPLLPLMFLNTVLFYVFVAGGHRLVCLGTLGLGALAGLALSFGLTKTYGAAGCATADLGREFIISATYLYFLTQGHNVRIVGTAVQKVLVGVSHGLLSATLRDPCPTKKTVGGM
jgi:O-antigen/teichoic acid export membrane protein